MTSDWRCGPTPSSSGLYAGFAIGAYNTAGVLTIPRWKDGETRHVPLPSTVRTIMGGLPRALNRSALLFPNSGGKRDLRWAEKAFPKIERLVTRQAAPEKAGATGTE